ncbi:arsenate reductase (glutaredoxin) [Candidatus Woesearchaeota archaeon]|nr:arsenate reductase (glutaredoxin) [Candidatus Woesearchaeota archaeon]
MKIYYNSRCSKCRISKNLLESKKQDFETINYLDNVPKKEELEKLCDMLKINPVGLLRKKESKYKELVKELGAPTDELALNWMVSHPILIERPIVVKGNKAVIARPAEKVLELL